MLFDVTDFDGDPVAALRAAAGVRGPVELHFPPGEHHLWPRPENRRELYVSNTVGADPRYRTKTIGLLVESIDDLVVSGDGARLVLHGLQTTFAVRGARRVRLRGLEFDFAAPTVIDATVIDAGPSFRVIQVPAGTGFAIDGRSVRWQGEPTAAGGFAWWGWDALGYTQIYDPAAGRTWRADNPLFRDVATVRQVAERELLIEYASPGRPADIGLVYAMRSTVRDHPGALISGSAEVTLSRLRFRYLHGFGWSPRTAGTSPSRAASSGRRPGPAGTPPGSPTSSRCPGAPGGWSSATTSSTARTMTRSTCTAPTCGWPGSRSRTRCCCSSPTRRPRGCRCSRRVTRSRSPTARRCEPWPRPGCAPCVSRAATAMTRH